MLESQSHEYNSFVTLTYDEKNVPEDGSVNPVHTQKWLKRLRAEIGQVRFFLVGEYGGRYKRPHYHAALFGFGHCPDKDAQLTRRGCSCPVCSTLRKTWSLGTCNSGELNAASARYIGGYIQKRMTKADDERLGGHHPEFARMSLRPGLGAYAVPSMADVLTSSSGARTIAHLGDVPMALRSEGKLLPLGRYLRRKLREELGFDETGGQAKPQAETLAEMSALYEAAGSRSQYLSSKPFIERQKILQLEGKLKIWNKNETL